MLLITLVFTRINLSQQPPHIQFFQQIISLSHAQPMLQGIPNHTVPGVTDIQLLRPRIVQQALCLLRGQPQSQSQGQCLFFGRTFLVPGENMIAIDLIQIRPAHCFGLGQPLFLQKPLQILCQREPPQVLPILREEFL